MPAPNGSTFDGNANASPPTMVGYRPGLPDFNGAALTNDLASPPDPATMPVAEVWNTFAYLITSICKMIGVATFAVNAGASPTMASWFTAALNIQANPFTITRVGAGNYQITWAAALLPVQGWPRAFLNVVGGAHSYSIEAVNITNGVQVYTQQDGVLTDLSFSVVVY